MWPVGIYDGIEYIPYISKCSTVKMQSSGVELGGFKGFNAHRLRLLGALEPSLVFYLFYINYKLLKIYETSLCCIQNFEIQLT